MEDTKQESQETDDYKKILKILDSLGHNIDIAIEIVIRLNKLRNNEKSNYHLSQGRF